MSCALRVVLRGAAWSPPPEPPLFPRACFGELVRVDGLPPTRGVHRAGRAGAAPAGLSGDHARADPVRMPVRHRWLRAQISELVWTKTFSSLNHPTPLLGA